MEQWHGGQQNFGGGFGGGGKVLTRREFLLANTVSFSFFFSFLGNNHFNNFPYHNHNNFNYNFGNEWPQPGNDWPKFGNDVNFGNEWPKPKKENNNFEFGKKKKDSFFEQHMNIHNRAYDDFIRTRNIIIGSVVGGIVFIAIAIFFIIFCVKRKNKRSATVSVYVSPTTAIEEGKPMESPVTQPLPAYTQPQSQPNYIPTTSFEMNNQPPPAYNYQNYQPQPQSQFYAAAPSSAADNSQTQQQPIAPPVIYKA